MGTCCRCAGYVTSATPTTGASLSTGPATTTTKTPGCPPAYPPDPPKTPSTPPAASTSATPPPGPEPPTNFEASPLVGLSVWLIRRRRALAASTDPARVGGDERPTTM